MASFFSNNQQAAPVSQRALYEGKYNTARMNLLGVVLFTVVNIILLATNGNTYFLFSASIPYYFADMGMVTQNVVLLAIAAGIILLYLLCWIFSKKNKVGWLVAALVLFILDTLDMITFGGIASNSVIDIALHVYVIWSLISGIIAHNKLKKLPEEEEAVVAAAEVPVVEAPEDVTVEATQEPAGAAETPAEAEEITTEAE